MMAANQTRRQNKLVTNLGRQHLAARQRKLRLAAGAAAFIPLSAVLVSHSARAATQYWEPTGTTGTNATGSWSTVTTTLNWNTDSTGAATPLTFWANGNDAIFSADANATGPSTITMSTAITVNSLTFGNSGVVGGTSSSSGSTGSYTFSNANVMTLGSANNTLITMAPGAGAVTLSGGVQVGATQSVADTNSITNNSSSLLTFAGQVGSNNGNSLVLTLNGTGSGGVTFSGALVNNYGSPNGSGRITTLVINTTGAGATAVTTLSNTGNFFRGTTITSGILATTNNNVLGTDNGPVANSSTISIGAAGQLNLSGTNQGIGALSGVAGGLIYNNSNTNSTLTIGNDNNGGGTYAGLIEDRNGGATTGTVALVKNGTNTITFSASQTYSGATTVNNGVLQSTLSGASLTPFGTGSLSLVGVGAASNQATSLIIHPGATGATTLTGGTGTGSQLSFTNTGYLELIRNAAGSPLTYTFGSGSGTVLNRVGQGVLVISDNAGGTPTNLGVSGGNNFLISGTAPTVTNGMVPAYILGGQYGAGGNGTFLTYGANGFAPVAYDLTNTFATSDNTKKVTFNGTLSSSAAAYAVQINNTTTINNGVTLTIGDNGTTPAGLILNNSIGGAGSTLAFGASEGIVYVNGGNQSIASNITGSAGLTKTQYNGTNGALTLNGSNTYTGATTVIAGNLTVGATGSLASGSPVSLVSGASLTNSGNIGGNLTSPAGTTVALNSGSSTSSGGTITANGAFTIAGASAVTLGTLNATGGTGSITTTNTAANTLTFSGANSLATIANNQTSSPLAVSLSSSATLTVANLNGSSGSTTNLGGDGTGTINISGVLGTAGQIVNFNAGTVFLNGGGQYNTTMIVNGATVNTQSDTSNGSNFQRIPNLQVLAGTLNVRENNGLRFGTDFGSGNGGTNSAAGIQSGGNIVFTNGAGLQLGGTNGTFTNTFALSGGVFNGTSAATNATNISISANTAGGASVSSFNFSGGTLLLSGTISGVGGTGAEQSFVWTGGTLAASAYNATNLTSTQGTAVSSSTNTLTNAGSGILAPGGVGTGGKTAITGNYSVTSPNASYAVDIGSTTQAAAFQSGLAFYDVTTVTGTAALGGRLTPSLINGFTPLNANTFTILTTAASGRSGTFTNTNVSKTANPFIVLPGAGLTGMTVTYGTANVVLGGYTVTTNTYSGASTSAWDAASAGSWTVFDPGSTSGGTVASGALAVFGNDSNATSGPIAVGLSASRDVQGVKFSSTVASNNYTVSNGGSGAIVLDNTGNSAAATIADSSASGNANAINVPITLNSNLAVTVSNAANTLTLGGNITENTPAGKTLSLSGSGTLALTGSSGYTGATAINGGTLRANNASALSNTASVTVASGATLGGNGGGTAPVIVSAGGNITAGVNASTPGALAINNLTLGAATGASANMLIKVSDVTGSGNAGTAGTNYDTISSAALTVPTTPANPTVVAVSSFGTVAGVPTASTASGNFDPNSTYVFQIGSYTSTNIPHAPTTNGGTEVLFDPNGVTADPAAAGLFTLDTSNFVAANSGTSSTNFYLEAIGSGSGTGGTLDVVYAGAPEPGTMLLALAGAAPVLAGRRRRRNATAR